MFCNPTVQRIVKGILFVTRGFFLSIRLRNLEQMQFYAWYLNYDLSVKCFLNIFVCVA